MINLPRQQDDHQEPRAPSYQGPPRTKGRPQPTPINFVEPDSFGHTPTVQPCEVRVHGLPGCEAIGRYRHAQPVRATYKMASMTARRECFSGLPIHFGDGTIGSTNSHSASVRSDGYRRARSMPAHRPSRAHRSDPPDQPKPGETRPYPENTFRSLASLCSFDRLRGGCPQTALPSSLSRALRLALSFHPAWESNPHQTNHRMGLD